MIKKHKKIKINETEYKIQKLALGKYAELLERLDKLPDEYTELFLELDIGKTDDKDEKSSNAQFVKVLPKLLAKSFPQTIDLISFTSGVPNETLIKECGLLEVVEILEAIWEINDFTIVKNKLASVFQTITAIGEKAKAREKTAEAENKTGSTQS